MSGGISQFLPTAVFCWLRGMCCCCFFFLPWRKYISNQWKVSSDYITTEMDKTGSSVKQPRKMESQKGTVEAARNKINAFFNKNG